MWDDFRAASIALLIGAGVLVVLAYITGCGPSVTTIRRQYVTTAEVCVSEAKALAERCPSGDACVAEFETLRAACDAQLADICNQSRRARRLCP